MLLTGWAKLWMIIEGTGVGKTVRKVNKIFKILLFEKKKK